MKDYFLLCDEELMLEIKADNMFAFDVLFKKYSKRLYKFGFSILKSKEEAENLVQDVYLNLWENRNNVEKNSSVKYYLFTIAYNSAISIIRKKVKESQYIEYLKTIQNTEKPVNLEIEYNELTDNLNKIIRSLPPRQKEVYLLHRVDGLKYNEIAEKLNISVNTIENHISRALKTIRKKLENYSLIMTLFVHLFL